MEKLEDVTWVLAATGALLLAAGILGGGVEFKGFKLPVLTRVTRSLSVMAGIVLIGLVTLPGINLDDRKQGAGDKSSQAPGTETVPVTVEDHGVEEDASVQIPDVMGLTEAAARDRLEKVGLGVGAITSQWMWEPDDRIVIQTPTPQNIASMGSTVDLVLADSDVAYRAERQLTSSDGEEIQATAIYGVRLIHPDSQDQLIGQFSLRSASISGVGAEFSHTIDELLETSGYVALNAVDQLELESAWQAYADLTKELEHETAVVAIDENPSLSSLGVPIMLAMASFEIVFDVRAMLTQVTTEVTESSARIELQAGSDLASTIWLEGPGVIADSGEARTYRIMRRAPDEEQHRKIGNATYTVADGLLSRMEVVYTLNDNKGVYRLKIERQ